MLLLPQPRRVTARAGQLNLTAGARIVCVGEPSLLFPIAQRLQQVVLETQRLEWRLAAGQPAQAAHDLAVITLDSRQPIPAQGYRLSIMPTQIQLTASDAAGAFYGVMTLRQLLRQNAGALPACEIEDQPDFVTRGVMLDISRDKVPTLETLFGLVDQLAEWKINHLELYTEHTFAYRNHPQVWAQASPMTGEDILRLEAYCRERFIELVPNQNSFGHMHRWLSLPRYRPLAECPEGFKWPHGEWDSHPFTLDPLNPASLSLLEELYADLLPHFSTRKFNVGCDETFDLGQGKSKAECERRGKGRVYLEFLLKIYELVKRHNRTMHFWGDIIIQYPELVTELPRDVVVLEWGYEADSPFDEHGAKFSQTGIPFYVCPGTSSWNTIAGRTDNCLGNLRNAALNGLKHGAIGFLNTDWGDNGHWQYLPVSYLGFAAGAALSWNHASKLETDLIPMLDRHVFLDSAEVMGKLVYDLGNTYQCVPGAFNGISLFYLLSQAHGFTAPPELGEKEFRAAQEHVQSTVRTLGQARMQRADAALIQAEFANAARMLNHASKLGIAQCKGTLSSQSVRHELADEMRIILGEHRQLWTARNRPGGLQDSVQALERRLNEYVQD
jgi:hexosaminidase